MVKKRLSRLPAYSPNFQYWLVSRRLNNLFTFFTIGTTEGFVHFDGLANVILTGRVYYRLLDLSEGEHSMRWFLYDKTARDRQEIKHEILQMLSNW
jgi:hypothetical protein